MVEDAADAVDDMWQSIRNVRFASTSEMFDTDFKPPDTVGTVANRWSTNFERYGLNYAVLTATLCGGFGLRIGMWMSIALVVSHASFKTRSVKSVVKSKVAKFFE